MDGFVKVIIFALAISLVTLGIIALIAMDNINKANIPDAERGLVVSKQVISSGIPANYTVTLSGGQVLYILNNATLYNSIPVNQTCTFACRLDFNNKMIIIQQVTVPTPSPTPSPLTGALISPLTITIIVAAVVLVAVIVLWIKRDFKNQG